VVTSSPAPTATAATPTAPKAAVTPPAKPKGMNANTAEGARKTALYFLQLYPYVMATGDLKEFDRLSVYGKDACEFCDSTRSDVLKYKKKHWTYSGGKVSAKVVHTYLRDDLFDAYPLNVQVTQDAARWLDSRGTVVDRAQSGMWLERIEVIRVGKIWKILTVSLMEKM
jgi:hypothetical protein